MSFKYRCKLVIVRLPAPPSGKTEKRQTDRSIEEGTLVKETSLKAKSLPDLE